MQRNIVKLSYSAQKQQFWNILFLFKWRVTEKRTCLNKLKFAYLLTVLLSLPLKRLPWLESVSKLHGASCLVCEYSLRRSAATTFVSTSVAVRTKKFKVWVIDMAYVTDNPTNPGDKLSLLRTAKSAEQNTIEFPTDSKRRASHLFATKAGKPA